MRQEAEFGKLRKKEDEERETEERKDANLSRDLMHRHWKSSAQGTSVLAEREWTGSVDGSRGPGTRLKSSWMLGTFDIWP